MRVNAVKTESTKKMTIEPKSTWRWTGYSFRAMNTKIQTWLYSRTNAEVLPDVQRLFNSFEKRFSRFDPDSELSHLNNCRQERFQASQTLLDALEAALWAAEMTGGLYDPTILNALEQAGYDRSFEQIAQPAAGLAWSAPNGQKNGHPSPGWSRAFSYRSIHLIRASREIFKPVGLRLDLGGIGKGWTVDRAADRLQGLGPFLINAGGDIYGYQTPPGRSGWEIDIIHPLQPDSFIARVHLHHRALATSTIARRRWQRNGRTMHHLIDPRTGQPAQTDALSVSVIADRTMAAEIYAKVALILGSEAGIRYLNRLPGIEGLIFTTAGEIRHTQRLEEYLDRLEPAGYAV
jgi:thiamine biosynthesis lipoprotein